jgi:hypothetical protein
MRIADAPAASETADPFAALHRPIAAETTTTVQTPATPPQYLSPQQQQTVAVHGAQAPMPRESEWIVEFDGGPAWRTAKIVGLIDSEQHAYLKKLKSGYNLGGRLGYFRNGFGVSLVYSNYMADTKGYMYATIKGVRLRVRTHDRITFVGPEFSFYSYNADEKWRFCVSWGLGYTGYASNITTVDGDKIKFSGGTFGTNFALGADYMFAKDWSMGPKIHMASGTLNSMTFSSGGQSVIQTLPDNQKEGLGNFSLLVGLKYHFGLKDR